MAKTPRGTSFHNGAPSQLPANAGSDLARVEFGKRLQRAMMDKGFSQSELARVASLQLGKHFGRDSVSQYIRGETLPNPERLAALARALGVSDEDLLPSRGLRGVRGLPSVTEMMRPGLEIREDEDERYQQVNLIGQRVKKERMKELLAIIYDID